MNPYPTVLYLPSIPSLILSFFTCDLPQQFNKFTFSLRGVGGRTVALGLSEGTGICSAEAYIIAKSIVIRDAFTPANLSLANYVKIGMYTYTKCKHQERIQCALSPPRIVKTRVIFAGY